MTKRVKAGHDGQGCPGGLDWHLRTDCCDAFAHYAKHDDHHDYRKRTWYCSECHEQIDPVEECTIICATCGAEVGEDDLEETP